jgi:hypothetical protein
MYILILEPTEQLLQSLAVVPEHVKHAPSQRVRSIKADILESPHDLVFELTLPKPALNSNFT